MFGQYLPDEDPFQMHLVKEAAYRALLASEGTRPIPGARRFVASAVERGHPVAVVTNAPRANADASLAAIGLHDAFGTVIVGEECSAGKPHPAPYMAALEALGVAPDRAVAFEDSPSGLASARAAGIPTVGIRSSLGADALSSAGATESIADFDDPGLWALPALKAWS